jgi:hypothetical protein
MDLLNDKFPKTAAWIEKLQPFIVLRGDKHLILKFSDGRESLKLSYDKINEFEQSGSEELVQQ